MEHGLKVIAFYVQKAYNTLHSCHNFPVWFATKPLEAPAFVKQVYLVQNTIKYIYGYVSEAPQQQKWVINSWLD